MKSAVFGILALAAVSGAAGAADVARPYTKAAVAAPVFSWTGCYIGGFVGGAKADGVATATDLDSFNLARDTWSYGMGSSFIGGGTVGCNYQVSSFVFGAEVEGGYLRSSGSAIDPLSRFLPNETTRSTTEFGDWYAVVAGRAGFAVDRALIYVKGGAAFVDTRVSILGLNGPETLIDAKASSHKATWALGGGMEYALSNNWTIKGEYLFIDTRQTVNACGVNLTSNDGVVFCWAHDVPGLHTAKLGLNYKFDTSR